MQQSFTTSHETQLYSSSKWSDLTLDFEKLPIKTFQQEYRKKEKKNLKNKEKNAAKNS